MNVAVRKATTPAAQAEDRLAIVDCDIHPTLTKPADLRPFLAAEWRRHFETFGSNSRDPFSDTIAYPRIVPALARADAWPPGGNPPGSDLDFMRAQHLDANNVEIGILMPLGTRGPEQRNVDYSAALCTALNDWQTETWTRPEPRLRGSILVPQESAELAVAEIERRAGDPQFVQVYLSPRWTSRHRFRLGLVLHRGSPCLGADDASVAHQPDRRRGVRAFSRSENRADRGRLRMGATARMAARRAVEAAEERSAASSAPAV
jgi:hypothetical protein